MCRVLVSAYVLDPCAQMVWDLLGLIEHPNACQTPFHSGMVAGNAFWCIGLSHAGQLKIDPHIS